MKILAKRHENLLILVLNKKVNYMFFLFYIFVTFSACFDLNECGFD